MIKLTKTPILSNVFFCITVNFIIHKLFHMIERIHFAESSSLYVFSSVVIHLRYNLTQYHGIYEQNPAFCPNVRSGGIEAL